MGLFDFFKKRRERESAIPEAELEATEPQPVVGQQVEGAQRLPDGTDLSELGTMIQSAIEQGNVTIEQGPSQTIDMRGTGLREEILGIMKDHGIDADAGSQESINAGDYPEMQQQILEALSKHGVDLDGSAQAQPPDTGKSD